MDIANVTKAGAVGTKNVVEGVGSGVVAVGRPPSIFYQIFQEKQPVKASFRV